MAKVTTKPAGKTFVLEFTEAEAQYVWAALYKSDPVHLNEDSVWNALHEALIDEEVERDHDAARFA